MYIRWQIEDGYAGPNRPHSFTIDDRDLEDMSTEEIDEYVDASIQDEFDQHISWTRLDSGD